MMSPLDNLLNQVNYPNKRRVKDDIKSLMERYKSLLPKVSTFVQNNGVESKVISLNGTIPITYSGAQYNLPIEIFVVDRYPTAPPKAYLRPTPTMTIKANHRHVDMQGCVYLPYLHEWNQTSSNLTGLVEMCSNVFSFDPPLFTKPTGAAALATTTNRNSLTSNPSTSYIQPVAQPVVQPIAQPVTGTNAYNYSPYGTNTSASPTNLYTPYTATVANSAYGTTGAVMATATAVGVGTTAALTTATTAIPSYNSYSNSSLPHQQSSSSSSNSNRYSFTTPTPTTTTTIINPAEKRENLVMEVTSKIQQEIYKRQQALKIDIDKEFANQRYLEYSAKQLTETKTSLIEMIESIQDSLLKLREQETELITWDAKESTKAKPEAEELLKPYDDLSQQILRLNGESNGIDDLFYYLEKGLMSKKIDGNTFLKESRQLARRQFLVKAHLLKIHNHLAALTPLPHSNNSNSSHTHTNNSSPAPPYYLNIDNHTSNSNTSNSNRSGTGSPQVMMMGSGGGGFPPPYPNSQQYPSNPMNSQVSPSHHLLHPQMTQQQQIQQQYPGMGNQVTGPYVHGINQHATNTTQSNLAPYPGISMSTTSTSQGIPTASVVNGVAAGPGTIPTTTPYSPYTFQSYK